MPNSRQLPFENESSVSSSLDESAQSPSEDVPVPRVDVNMTNVPTWPEAKDTVDASHAETSREQTSTPSRQQATPLGGLILDEDSLSDAELPHPFPFFDSPVTPRPSPELSPDGSLDPLERVEVNDSSPVAEAEVPQHHLHISSPALPPDRESRSRKRRRPKDTPGSKASSRSPGSPRHPHGCIYHVPSCFEDKEDFNDSWYRVRLLAFNSNRENTPAGSYRDQHGHLYFDYTWPTWRNHVEECLMDMGYSRTAQIEAWIGTDYLDPELDDERVFPAHAEIIRNRFLGYTVGRDTAIQERLDDLELQSSGYPTFNRNIPSIPRPGPSQTPLLPSLPSFSTRSTSPQQDDPTPMQSSQDPHAPQRIDMSASKGKGKALSGSEPPEDPSGTNEGAPPEDPDV